MPVAVRPAVALVALAALWGCDAAPGFAVEAPRPVFDAVAVTPVAVALDTDAQTATVPLAVEGTLAGEGPVEVRVVARWSDTDSLVVEAAETVQPGPFRVEAPFSVPRGAVGEYAVRVSTEGADGRAGDQAAAVVRFAATNLGPPSVSVNEPGAVTRPEDDDTVEVPLLATVTDPDGLANVAVVIARVPDGGGTIGRLYDDGQNRDETEGDGRYSAALLVDAGFEPGVYAFEIVAVDRYGALSEPAPFTFTVR